MKRRSQFLPEMDSATRVTEQLALIDRVILRVGRWSVIGSKEEIAGCMSNLTSVTLNSSDNQEIPMFVAKTCSTDHNHHLLEVRSSGSGVNRLAESPALSGKLKGYVQRWRGAAEGRAIGVEITGTAGINTRGRLSVGSYRCSIALHANLNLTRWLQGQVLRRPVRGRRLSGLRTFRLTVGCRSDWHLNERPLCMDSNLIIGGAGRYAYAMCKSAEDHFRDYLNTLEGEISDGLDFHSDGRSSFFEEYRLSDIEFYWEFSHRNPIEFVNMLFFYLPRVAKRMKATRRQLSKTSIQYHEQSICINVFLPKGIRISVYAKTDQRVRFELCFPKGYKRHNSWRASTFGGKDALLARVSVLKTIATDTMNSVLESLRVEIGDDPNRPNPAQLRQAIANAAADPFMATTIVETLATQRRIRPGIKDPIRSALIQLKKNNVLRYLEGDKSIFVVTPHYEYARRNLRYV